MQILASSTELTAALKKCQGKYHRWSAAVAWASIGFPAWDYLLKHRRKIHKMTIGTHFYQTHPEVLERLAGDPHIRFVQQTSGIYHPKVYLFEKGVNEWACICGSANFTSMATSTNTEVCIMIDQRDAPEAVRAKLLDVIESAWDQGTVPKPEYIAYYRKQWKLKQARLRELAGGEQQTSGKQQALKKKISRPLHEIGLVRMTWPEFVGRVKKEYDGEYLLDRLNVLEAGRDIFRRSKKFADISLLERKKIAGAVGSGEDGLEWKWFGSMQGAGRFKRWVNQHPEQIGAAIDAIPLDGDVTDAHFDEFRRLIQSLKGISLGSGTRLVMMKRPDIFVPFNGPNQKKLAKACGLSQDIDWETYWQSIVGRIRQAIWYQEPSPKQPLAKRIWNGRAAMLDALYYDESLK